MEETHADVKQNEQAFSGLSASSTIALLFNSDLEIKCFRKSSPLLVVDIRKCDCIFTSLSGLFLPLPIATLTQPGVKRPHHSHYSPGSFLRLV